MTTLTERINKELGRDILLSESDKSAGLKIAINNFQKSLVEDFSNQNLSTSVAVDRTSKKRNSVRILECSMKDVIKIVESHGARKTGSISSRSMVEMRRGDMFLTIMDGAKHPTEFSSIDESVVVVFGYHLDESKINEVRERNKHLLPVGGDSYVRQSQMPTSDQFDFAGVAARTGVEPQAVHDYMVERKEGMSILSSASVAGISLAQANDVEIAFNEIGTPLGESTVHTIQTNSTDQDSVKNVQKHVMVQPQNPNSAFDVLVAYRKAIEELLPEYTIDRHEVEFGGVMGNDASAILSGEITTTGESIRLECVVQNTDEGSVSMYIGIHVPERDCMSYVAILPTYPMGMAHSLMQHIQSSLDTKEYNHSDTGMEARDQMNAGPNVDFMVDGVESAGTSMNEAASIEDDEKLARATRTFHQRKMMLTALFVISDELLRLTNNKMPEGEFKDSMKAVYNRLVKNAVGDSLMEGHYNAFMKTQGSGFEVVDGYMTSVLPDRRHVAVRLIEGLLDEYNDVLGCSTADELYEMVGEHINEFKLSKFAEAFVDCFESNKESILKEAGSDMIEGDDLNNVAPQYLRFHNKEVYDLYMGLTEPEQIKVIDMAFPDRVFPS